MFSALDDALLVNLLNSGAVGVIPTDTVYGLVARAADPDAVTRLYNLKHRVRKPGTVIAGSIQQLLELGLESKYIIADQQFWPGPISVVIPHNIEYMNQGIGSQPFRIPDDEELRKLLLKTGPLQTTSANHPTEEPAANIREAQSIFGELVDFYVDGGEQFERPPSTIIRINNGKVEVIREGAAIISEDGRVIKKA